jgi:hypothetical protein
MIQDVSSKMVDQFAACLASQFDDAVSESGESAQMEAQAPVNLSLMFGAL